MSVLVLRGRKSEPKRGQIQIPRSLWNSYFNRSPTVISIHNGAVRRLIDTELGPTPHNVKLDALEVKHYGEPIMRFWQQDGDYYYDGRNGHEDAKPVFNSLMNGLGKWSFKHKRAKNPETATIWMFCDSKGSILLDRDADGLVVPQIQKTKARKLKSYIGNTYEKRNAKSRKCQSIFKNNVLCFEKGCRITGVTDERMLVAGHLKPYSLCATEEAIDGENGLLFTPSIDHLVDKGYISFSDDGSLLVSPNVDKEIVNLMGVPIDGSVNIGTLTSKQKEYLAYHRECVFQWTRSK